MNPYIHPLARAVAALCAGLTGVCTYAQTPASSEPRQPNLDPVVVTANPLGRADALAPVSQVGARELMLRGHATLGDSLSSLPGVAASGFGPNASRPVVRGLDGERVRILQNSSAAEDASSLSADHAVALDPLVIERVEVLRGPGALLYGASAVGGVVNLLDNRIPQAPIARLAARLQANWDSGTRERAGAAVLEGGSGAWAWHVDGAARRAEDARVPVELACERNGQAEHRWRLCNAANRTDSGAMGLSWFGSDLRLGASVAEHRSRYGVAAAEDVEIDMGSRRWAFEASARMKAGFWTAWDLWLSRTDYAHTEWEGGAPGTRFSNLSTAWRATARHAPLAGWQGVVGAQGESSDFAADGDEAFAPYSRTRRQALFLYEERDMGAWSLSLGARAEQVTVRSLGHPDLTHFAVGERRFAPVNLAFQARWRFAPGWDMQWSGSAAQRAPRDTELFADGPHVATAAYERGDAQLGLERSRNVEWGVGHAGAQGHWRAQLFVHRFANYISDRPTGAMVDVDGEGLPERVYQGVPARLWGAEWSGRQLLAFVSPHTHLRWRLDLVRGVDLSTGQALSRMAPRRVGLEVEQSRGPWAWRVGLEHHGAQNRVAQGEQPVAGYTLWNAAITRQHSLDGAQATWFLRLDNATDRLAYSATSVLTQTAPGRVPLAGRSLRVGVRWSL